MSFINCIRNKGTNKLLSPAQVKSIEKEYNALVNQYTETMGSADAAAMAAQKITETQMHVAAEARSATLKQALMSHKLMTDIQKELVRQQEAYDALPKIKKALTRKPTRAQATIDVLETAHRRGETLARELFKNLDEVSKRFGDKWFETASNSAAFRQVLGKMIDGDLSDPMAVAMRDSTARAHKEYTQAGGSLGYIENYAPQMHEASRVSAVDFDEWYGDVLPLLDRNRMLDESTGLPMSDEVLEQLSRQAYDDISTDGRAAINRAVQSGEAPQGMTKDVWNSRQQSRFFHFKDSESFFKYNDKYGVGDEGLLHAFNGHLMGMSRDIGIMQKLGPKPNAMMHQLDHFMAGEDAPYQRRLANMSFNVLAGGVEGGTSSAFYRSTMAIQNLLRASLLGSAPISALSDGMFVKIGADMYGMNGYKAMGNYLGSVTKKGDRQLVSNAAHTVEAMSGSGINAYRLYEGNGWLAAGNKGERAVAAASKTIHRASGLRAMTEAAGDGVSMELASNLAVHAKKNTSWDNLPPEFRKGLHENGIDEADWKIIKKADPVGTNGTAYITPEQIAAITSEASETVLNVSRKVADLDVQLRYLVTNSPRLRTRAVTTMGARHGTATRAIATSVGMFKSFPLEVMQNFLLPTVRNAGGGQFGGLFSMVIGTTLLGSLALQLKDVVKGREPRDADNSKFWIAAAMQGGGFGLFGDFFFTEHGRFGRNFITDFLGPVAGFSSDAMGLGLGHVQKAIMDEEYKFQEEFLTNAVDFMHRYTPAQSLWYARAAIERGIFESLERAADPNFDNTMRKKEQKIKKDYGNDFWWGHGDVTPQF